jgi:hypothetical protein
MTVMAISVEMTFIVVFLGVFAARSADRELAISEEDDAP